MLLTCLGGYLWALLSRRESVEEQSDVSSERPWLTTLGALLGLGLLVGGAQLLVSGATLLARSFGVPELVIGLTLVAVGTSLPELATAGVAALRRESDIALGNVVGSNIFNVLFILGATALVRPIHIAYRAVALNLWLMVGLSLLLLPLLLTGLRLGRREGGLLLVLYVFYVGYLYLG